VARFLAFSGISGRHYCVTPEQAFLYLTANPYAGQDMVPRVQQVLHQGLCWDTVMDLSVRHGVIGLWRRFLRQAGLWDELPPLWRSQVDQWQGTVNVMHLSLMQQVRTILNEAGRLGIEPVVLKGAAVATTAYPSPNLRSMGDVDLLVHAAERHVMAKAMESMGYVAEEVYYHDEFNTAHGYHYRFRDPGGRLLPVEVHWELASRLERRNRLSAALLWGATERGTMFGANKAQYPGSILRPEMQLVYLATHAASEGHAFGRLIWLADLAAIIGSQPALDWEDVVTMAAQARGRTAVFLALTFTRQLLASSVPGDVLARLRPSRLVVRAVDRSLNPRTLLVEPTGERRAIVKYLVVDQPRRSLSLFLRRLVPAPAVVRVYSGDPSLVRSYLRHVGTIGGSALQKTRDWLVHLVQN
jgi:hypothetical protein